MALCLHWFRNDLRLHDQPAVAQLPVAASFLGVFILEPRFYKQTPWGWPRLSGHRLRFLRQSLACLKSALQARGSDLVILAGDPALLLPKLVCAGSVSRLTWQREHTREELDVETAVRQALAGASNLAIQTWEGLSLVHPDDLPFGPALAPSLPDVFTAFRKAVEPLTRVREPLRDHGQPLGALQEPFALNLRPTPGLALGHDSTLERTQDMSLGLTPRPTTERIHDWPNHALDPANDADWPKPAHPLWRAEASPDTRTAFPFSGGEAAGLERLSAYVRADGALRTYKETRNGLLGADYSSKLSAWLANGCLSPRQVYQAVKLHEERYGGNDSTYWLIFELLWRDFFRFQAIKQGDLLFSSGGSQQRKSSRPENRAHLQRTIGQNQRAFERWAAGATGQPFIDANMRELAATGWMSNRGRQNVASYLVHDLGLAWQMGAWWFEALLLDYDVASNWGNWQYAAGVGLDPRSQGSGQRRFNPAKQASQYDPDGTYVRLWADERVK